MVLGMYQIVYYSRITEDLNAERQEFQRQENDNEKFRLRRTALHYVSECLEEFYRHLGYVTEKTVGGISCYKSEKTENGNRKITEVRIKVEKL